MFNPRGNAAKLVSILVKAFVEGHRLGRFCNLQSAVLPLKLEELDVLTKNVEFGKKKLVAKSKETTNWNGAAIPITKALEVVADDLRCEWIPTLRENSR